MPAVQRQGDSNIRGGVVSSGDASVRVNGLPIAVQGSPITPYSIGKVRAPAVTTGSSTVRVNGRSVTLANNSDSRGTAMTGGSSNVTAT